MPARLRVIGGPDLGRTFTLPSDAPFVIGRGRESATQLQDLHMSRSHCRVQFAAGQWRVADLNSFGGTMVNGQPVTEGPLRAGDVIQVGDTQLRLEEASLADQATLPPPTPGLHIPVALPLDATPQPPAAPQTAPPSVHVPFPQPVAPPRPVPLASALGSIPFVEPLDELEVVESIEPELVQQQPLPRLPGERMGDLAGKVLAHFRLGGIVARGKSGVLFRARDIETDREVALKVLRPEFATDGKEVNRFIRSMRTALPLRHPNLVLVHAAGKKGPYCWISMEFIEGESLTQVIGRIGVAGMLDWRHAFRVASHVGAALEYAHGRQIVHRNMTPQNILISKAERQVKLGDLMLAKALEGNLAQQLTRPGEVVGDVRYMAPEQVRSPTHTDARADLYSLGALLYALLTGRPPIEGESLMDILPQVGRPPAMKPKQFQMSIPDAFEGVVLQLLSPRPEDRFQSAADLLKALDCVGRYHGLNL